MTLLSLVVNPSAGHGRAGRLTRAVERAFAAAGITVVTTVTAGYEHARNTCEDAVASGVDGLVVVGGDGMAHLGHNACANSGVPLGVIPAGTGNDFVRGVGLPAKWADAVASVVAGHVRTIDLMEVHGELDRGAVEYVGSVVSTGFDERVNFRANRAPFDLGAPTYAWAVLAELRRFTPLGYRLTVDGSTRELEAMLVAVANVGVFGGGIRIAPDYDLADGLLDVTIVHAVGRRTLLALFPQLFTGTFVSHPAVERLRVASIGVDGDGLYGMADGEVLGRPPLTCRAAPGALRIFAPATGDHG